MYVLKKVCMHSSLCVRRFPRWCLWNSSNIHRTDNGPFSSFEGRPPGTAPFFTHLLHTPMIKILPVTITYIFQQGWGAGGGGVGGKVSVFKLRGWEWGSMGSRGWGHLSVVVCGVGSHGPWPQCTIPPENQRPFHNYSCPLHLTNLYCQVVWTAGLAQHADTPGERIMEHLSEDANQNTVKCSAFTLPLHLGFVRNGDLRKNLNQSISDPPPPFQKWKKNL